MQRNFFSCVPLLALLLSSQVPLFPQGKATSEGLYNLFIGRGFKTDYQGLSPSQSEIYPRNIIVTIPAAPGSQSPSTGGSPTPAGSLENVFLIFPQEDVVEVPDPILELAGTLKGSNQPFTVKLVLAANEGNSPLPQSEEFQHPSGISVFAENLDGGENSCVIITRRGFRSRISSGGGGTVAPIWLIKSLKDSCEEQDISTWLPNSASFLYRLGFISEDDSLSLFLGESIPAAGLYLRSMEDAIRVLPDTLEKLSQTDTSSWDVHYSYVSFLSLEFWLDETFFLLCYISAAIIVLLRICFSTLGNSDKKTAIIKDLSKSWYLILVLLAFTAGILELSQHIPLLQSRLAAATLGQRLVTVMAATLLLFMLFSRFKIFISFGSASRIMLLMAACNIFIFCAMDISFLFLFFFEYLACLLARRTKGRLAIVATMILMATPFIPHAVNIFLSSNPRSLARFARPGPVGNLFTALIIFPFQVQFLRLLMQMDFFSQKKRRFVLIRLLSAILFISASVFSFAMFYFLILRTLAYPGLYSMMKRIPTMTLPEIPRFSADADHDYIQAVYSSDDFMEYKFISLTVRAEEGCQLLRYDVSLETESGIPLNDCNYSYSLSGRHKAYIAVPDNPSTDLSIVFTCSQ
ncbi:MAG: hypothetical protein ILP18_08720, partial [Treponema sp.]|nr:hypothetical protein [Treponema sp.]